MLNKTKMILIISLLIILNCFMLCSCGKELSLYEQVTSLTSYPKDLIGKRFVSPANILKEFEANYTEAKTLYENVELVIPANYKDFSKAKVLQDGKNTDVIQLVYKDDSGSVFTSTMDYNSYAELLTITYTTTDDDGNEVENNWDNYCVKGYITSVVGDGKYNVVMSNCKLYAVNKLYPISEQIENASQIEDSSNTESSLDVSSGENIDVTTNNNYYYDDYNNDGREDILQVNSVILNPSSPFEKLVFNNILPQISSDLTSTYNFSINGGEATSIGIKYPLIFNNIQMIETNAYNGEYLNLIQIYCDGYKKTDIDFANNKDSYINALPILKTNKLLLTSQYILCSCDGDKVVPITFKLLDGSEIKADDNNRILLNNITIDEFGNITGDIYVKALYPYEHYYQTSFRLLSRTEAEECSITETAISHEFYDVDNFEENEKEEDSLNYLTLTEDIVLPFNKTLFDRFELDDKYIDDIFVYGSGYTENSEDKAVNICKIPAGTKIYLKEFTQDLIEDDLSVNNKQYWIHITAENGEEDEDLYIPISFTNDLTNKDFDGQVLGTGKTFNELFIKK